MIQRIKKQGTTNFSGTDSHKCLEILKFEQQRILSQLLAIIVGLHVRLVEETTNPGNIRFFPTAKHSKSFWSSTLSSEFDDFAEKGPLGGDPG